MTVLTRLKLNITSPHVLKALANREIFHAAIEASQNPETAGRTLWRIDTLKGDTYLLILSPDRLDNEILETQFCLPDEKAEVKDYSRILDHVVEGSRWRFKLAANPICYEPRPEGSKQRSKIYAPFADEKKMEWLENQSKKNGFSIDPDQVSIIGTERITILKNKHHPATLQQVTFQGALTVTDPELFREALVSGIGRGKAYGMGLLTVAPCHD